MNKGEQNGKSLESWIWDAACSIRGAKDAPKYKEFILPLFFTKRLCDVFDDEINRIAQEIGSRAKGFKLVKHDKKLVRFFLPLAPKNPDDAVWSIVRTLSDKIGEQLTTHLRAIADPPLSQARENQDTLLKRRENCAKEQEACENMGLFSSAGSGKEGASRGKGRGDQASPGACGGMETSVY